MARTLNGWQRYVLNALPNGPGLTLDQIEAEIKGMRHTILKTLKQLERRDLIRSTHHSCKQKRWHLGF